MGDHMRDAVLAGLDAMRLMMGLPLRNHTPEQIVQLAQLWVAYLAAKEKPHD